MFMMTASPGRFWTVTMETLFELLRLVQDHPALFVLGLIGFLLVSRLENITVRFKK